MYQYENVKLEKGLYHLTNKNFLQALEEADPSAQYLNTPLSSLDAYERQLKRFDIRVSGRHCDKVEKFFTTTESAVLFPEFIRRAVIQGMEESVLSQITAAVTFCETNRYLGCDLSDTNSYSTTSAAAQLPTSSIVESSSVITVDKYGRNIQASYEAIRQQRLDILALMLRRVGKRLADSILTKAITVMKISSASSKITLSDEELAYADLAALYGRFGSFSMKVMLASPAVTAHILAMEQMREASSENVTEIRLPFGAKLINCPSIDNNTILGMDTDFALEQIQSSEVILETDKIIERQLDSITVSVNVTFRTLMVDAVKMLDLS